MAGAAIGVLGASSASSAQRRSARDATRIQQEQYTQTVERNRPFTEAGYDALDQLRQRMPALSNSQYDPEALVRDPGYQFGLQQGLDNVQNTAAARGGLYSGNALKALTRYGNDYATQQLGVAHERQLRGNQQSYNMLSGLANLGQQSANNTSAYGSQFGSQAGENIIGAGNAQAAGYLGAASAVGNAWNRYRADQNRNPNAAPYAGSGWAQGQGFGSGTQYGEQDLGQFLAEGGRVEPRVGTRSPLRSGRTGGGMSPEAIRAALDAAQAAAQQPAAPQPGTMAALPANPATNPRAIVEGRMRNAGAYSAGGRVDYRAGGKVDYRKGGKVSGKSMGRADDVPARLSAGEHVIDAETVALLGEGNSEAGHALLDEMKARVRAARGGG